MKRYRIRRSFIASLRREYKDIEIAKIYGYHKSTISNLFSNRFPPSKDFIIKTCFLMDISPKDFLK